MAILKKFLIILILSMMILKINGASIAQTIGSESMIDTADPPKVQEHITVVDTPFGLVVIPSQTEATNETISNGSTSTESPSTYKPTTPVPGDSRTGLQGLIPAANETSTIKKPYPTDIHKQGQIIIR